MPDIVTNPCPSRKLFDPDLGPPFSGKLVSDIVTNPCPSRKMLIGGRPPSGKVVSFGEWSGIRFPEGAVSFSERSGIRASGKLAPDIVTNPCPSGKLFDPESVLRRRLRSTPARESSLVRD